VALGCKRERQNFWNCRCESPLYGEERQKLSHFRSGTAADGLTCNCAKFFVYLITMVGGRVCGQVLVQCQTFMRSSLDGNEWSGSPSGRSYSGGRADTRLTSPHKRHRRCDEKRIAYSCWDRTPAV
jgi:hypothetical protein